MKKFLLTLCLVGGWIPLGSMAAPTYCPVSEEPILLSKATNLNPKVLDLALTAYNCALQAGYNDSRQLLTVIDYSLPSTQKRMWVIDLANKQVLFNTLVAQGKFTGALFAKYFSNKPQSKQSSIGLFLTTEVYQGHNGTSLRMKGLDVGFNDNAEARDIVIHGAWYVSDDFVKHFGRLGQSWGCPAVGKDVAPQLINTIKGGTFVFSYYPNPDWLANSKFLHCNINQ